MSDLNEWVATGTITNVEHKEYNSKPFIEVTLNSKNYKDEPVSLPFTIWGNAVDKFAANIGDLVAVKGSASSRQNGEYVNVSLSAYAVDVLSSGGLVSADPVEEIDLADDIEF